MNTVSQEFKYTRPAVPIESRVSLFEGNTKTSKEEGKKMERKRRVFIRGSLIAIFLVALFSLSFAASPVERVAPTVTATLPTQADLSINGIYALECKCDLTDVDALYMKDISVDVGKRDISTPERLRSEPSAVVGTLRVTYHNYLVGRVETHTLMIQNSHIHGGGMVRVVRNPVLIKKSVGVRAEIQLNSPGYANIDPNPANNVMIQRNCVMSPPR